MSEPDVASMVVNLWQLAQRHNALDSKLLVRESFFAMRFISYRSDSRLYYRVEMMLPLKQLLVNYF